MSRPLRVLLNSPLLPFTDDRGISPLASGDKGSAPLTAPPFEKGGRKLSNWVSANIADSLINQNLKYTSSSGNEETNPACTNIDSRLSGLPDSKFEKFLIII